MEYRNGFFQLCIKNDGVYMKIFPAMNGGESLKFEEVSRYLTSKKIMDYDLKTLHDAVTGANAPVEVKLSSQTVLPENEHVQLSIVDNNMTVVGRFYPPSTGGKPLTKQEIVNDLVHNGVKFGVIEENIDNFFKHREYCTDLVLAKGLPSVKGSDAEITYHFNTDTNAKPKLNEDGSVDFHQLDLISKIQRGDVLATLKPVVFGKPGIDVLGKPIPPDKVLNRVLKYGKDIYLSEDGCTMYSDVSGHVKLDVDKVIVSNVYEVTGDVNTATGDINYDGNVHVKGNVISGFTVIAKGDIEVEGVVEGATLIAGGQIILKRGVQGMTKGKLHAKGNIVTKFIESCEVKSEGNVTSGAILHSKVAAKGEIIVNGKNGSVTGGELRSGTMISVKTVGSTMGTHTELSVGTDPILVDELRTLEAEIPSMEEERIKMQQVVTLLQRKLDNGEKLAPDKEKYLQIASQNSILLEENLATARRRYDELRIAIENSASGSVKVSNIAYPGVKIVISNVVYYVRSEQHYCQFIREGADIVMRNL